MGFFCGPRCLDPHEKHPAQAQAEGGNPPPGRSVRTPPVFRVFRELMVPKSLGVQGPSHHDFRDGHSIATISGAFCREMFTRMYNTITV